MKPLKDENVAETSTDEKPRKRRNPFNTQRLKEEKERRQKKRARLIIRNISYKSTEESLREHFSKWGTLEDVNILKRGDGKLVGCAFVQYETINQATKAILHSNGKELQGRKVFVDWALGKDEYVSKHPKSEEPEEKKPKVEVKEENGESIELDSKEEVKDEDDDSEGDSEVEEDDDDEEEEDADAQDDSEGSEQEPESDEDVKDDKDELKSKLQIENVKKKRLSPTTSKKAARFSSRMFPSMQRMRICARCAENSGWSAMPLSIARPFLVTPKAQRLLSLGPRSLQISASRLAQSLSSWTRCWIPIRP